MRLPDGPKTPRLLRMVNLIARPMEYMDTYARCYGDPFMIRGKRSPGIVYFSSPQALQEIFTASPEVMDAGTGNGVLRFLLGENSLVLLDGSRHQQQRRLLMPPFHGDRMRTYGQLIRDITLAIMKQFQVGESFSVRSPMQEITLRVILQAVFGLHEGPRFQQLRQLISTLMNSIGSPLSSSLLFFPSLQKDWGPLSPWGRFLRLRQQIDRLLFDEIRNRRDSGNLQGSDILTLLMLSRDEAGQPMTDEELRDELLTLLVAGHETTASALTWALYWVHHLPEIGDKLLYELETLGSEATSEIARLPYLTAVCQETLRIYPVAMTAMVRLLKSPFQIVGYQFEKGTALIPCTYLTHHREDIYPEPKRFKPERFLERQFSPYEYLPFGGGHRRCIGLAFAQMEMKIALATILQQFQLKLVDSRPVRPVRRGLIAVPPSSMRMVVAAVRS
jgi:cytochrome P450